MMQTGMTLYISHTVEAVAFYREAFGLSLGYHVKFPDGTYLHAELQKNGENVFAVSEASNGALAAALHDFAKRGAPPTTSIGMKLDTQEDIERAYHCLKKAGVVVRPLGPLPWSACSADVLDKYGVYWYIYL